MIQRKKSVNIKKPDTNVNGLVLLKWLVLGLIKVSHEHRSFLSLGFMVTFYTIAWHFILLHVRPFKKI